MPYRSGFMYIIGAQVLFFIVTIVLILWFVRDLREKETTKDTLDRRLVSGEIRIKEYELLLKIVQKGAKK